MDLNELKYDCDQIDKKVISITEKVDVYIYEQGDVVRFRFSINTFTNPAWRLQFERVIKKDHELNEKLSPYPFEDNGYDRKRIHIHGSEIDLTCKPDEIQHLLSAVKLAMVKTNEVYEKIRKEQIENKKNEVIAAEKASVMKRDNEHKIQSIFANLEI